MSEERLKRIEYFLEMAERETVSPIPDDDEFRDYILDALIEMRLEYNEIITNQKKP